MKKNYPHNVIRLRKGKRTKELTYHIIVILNKKKVKSSKIIHKLGYVQFGKKNIFTIDFYKLAFFLNKGYSLKKSVKLLLGLIAYNIKKNG